MRRLDIIDGMRGYFLVFMLINHLVFAGDYWLVQINHRQLAFVEDAQGFVFLSGLLIGLVYARKMEKRDYTYGAQAIRQRAGELYLYAIGTILAVLILANLLPGATAAWGDWLGDLRLDDPVRMASAAAFLFQPTFMDILPQYVIYMVFAPPLIWLCLRGRWVEVLVASFLLWVAGQLGLQRLVTLPLNEALVGDGELGLRASFNLLAWQIVFFSALVLGSLTAQGRIDWSRVFTPERSVIPLCALAVCLFFLPLRIATAHGFMPMAVLEQFVAFEVRRDFGLVYLVNFAAVATGFAWLLIAGPRHERAWVRRLAGGLRWLFTLSFLRLLGRHSLQVYVWHVLLVYAVRYLDEHTPDLAEATKIAIALICIALLALPALWQEREDFRRRSLPAR